MNLLLDATIHTAWRSTNINHLCCPEHEPIGLTDHRSAIIKRRLGQFGADFTRAHRGPINRRTLQC